MYVREEEWEVVYRNVIAIADVSYDFLFTALELSALQMWLARPARESDGKVFNCDSHVHRAVTRSDGSVLPVCSFPFCVFSARSFVVARFVARSALDCWFELLSRQVSLSSTANCCGRCENKVASLYFTFISVMW